MWRVAKGIRGGVVMGILGVVREIKGVVMGTRVVVKGIRDGGEGA